MSIKINTIFMSGLLLLFYTILPADEVTLKNGTKITCVVIAQDNKAVLVETEFGSVTLKKDTVIAVKSDPSDVNQVLRGDFFEKKAKYDEALK